MTLASKLTVARIVFAPIIVLIAAIGFPNWNYYAAGVFVVASLTDTLDGEIARRYNQISDFGKLIDPIADKLLTSAAMIVLIAWQKFPAWVGMILVARDVMVSAMRIMAAERELVVAARNSGKIKTLLQLTAYGAYLFKWNLAGHILLAGAVATTLWSLFDYLYANRHVCRGELLTPFVLSFADKLFTACLAFWLIGRGSMPGLLAMLLLGKDNILSGVRAMTSANGRVLKPRFSEMASFVLSSAMMIAIALGAAWGHGVGLGLSILTIISTLWCVIDTTAASRNAPTRAKRVK